MRSLTVKLNSNHEPFAPHILKFIEKDDPCENKKENHNADEAAHLDSIRTFLLLAFLRYLL